MSDTMTADLETGAGAAALPDASSGSMESLLDTALADESPPPEQTPPDVPATPTASDRGDGRDDKGRFATKAEQAAQAAVATQPGQQPTVAPKAGEQPVQPAGTPFRYRAMGQTHALDGATINDAGDIIVPAARGNDLREAFNALHLVRGEYGPAMDRQKQEIAARDAKIAELTQSGSVNEQRAKTLVDSLSALMNEQDPNQFFAKAWTLREQWPILQARAESEFYKQQHERATAAQTKPAQPAPPSNTQQAQSMPSPDDARATLREYFERLQTLAVPDLRGLTDEDWKQLSTRYDATPYAFLRPATADEAQQYQLRAGQLVFDHDAFESDAKSYAKSVTEQRETARKQTALAVDNTRRTQSSVNAPPMAGGTQAPPKGGGKRQPQTTEELIDAALEDDD